jgi:hypothetical protein
MMASNGVFAAASSAPSPFPITSTAKPSAWSALRTNEAVFLSSSTTSTRMNLLFAKNKAGDEENSRRFYWFRKA